MTVADQINILDRKTKENEAQNKLDIKAAKISALSFGNLGKYEYLTGEDLSYWPSTFKQAKFDYSPLSNIFNKGLKEEDKKGLLKRLKNIGGKSEEHLKSFKNKSGIKSYSDLFDENLTSEAIALIKEIKIIEDNVNYVKLSFTGGNKKVCGFASFKIF